MKNITPYALKDLLHHLVPTGSIMTVHVADDNVVNKAVLLLIRDMGLTEGEAYSIDGLSIERTSTQYVAILLAGGLRYRFTADLEEYSDELVNKQHSLNILKNVVLEYRHWYRRDRVTSAIREDMMHAIHQAWFAFGLKDDWTRDIGDCIVVSCRHGQGQSHVMVIVNEEYVFRS